MIDKLSWVSVYPEIVLLVMACLILLVDLTITSARRTGTYVLSLLTLGAVGLLQLLYADAARPFTALATWWSATPWEIGSNVLPWWQ